MPITDDLRFEFDVQGYLHLRGALTAEEVATYTRWMNEVEGIDVRALNADNPDGMKHQLNRPVSRVVDADPRFGRFFDHPAVEPFLVEFLGEDYKHIDNEVYYTYPGYAGGKWHRGVRPHPTGHVVDGKFICPMVKVFYCMTDVDPNEGEFEVVPGSHRAQFTIDHRDRLDLPAQHIFNDVKAGDIILFNEGLIHNGRPNPSQKTRKTIIVNFGRHDAVERADLYTGLWVFGRLRYSCELLRSLIRREAMKESPTLMEIFEEGASQQSREDNSLWRCAARDHGRVGGGCRP